MEGAKLENVVFNTTNHDLTETALRCWIESASGHWNTTPRGGFGVVQSDDATIYLDFYPGDDLEEYEPDEIVEMERKLGGPAAAFVSIHIGHAPRSNDLARSVCRQFIDTWGGYVDANGISSWEDLY